MSSYTITERSLGASLARAAIGQFAGPPGEGPPGDDVHELVITHNFLIGWFVAHALHAPDWRWIGLNRGVGNGAVTSRNRRARSADHLTVALPARWTARWTAR